MPISKTLCEYTDSDIPLVINEVPYMRLDGLQRRRLGVLSAYVEVFERDLD